MAEFHFLRPAWLLLLVPIAVLAWHARRGSLASGRWMQYIDPRLREHVLIAPGGVRAGRRPFGWLALAAALSAVALAGPVWERLPLPVFNDSSALAIVLDLSASMDAADVKPSRLARARYKLADLLDRRRSGVTALVVYAGDAFTVTPLTDDVATIKAMLPSLKSDIVPAQGSRADLAVAQALELFTNASLPRGEILLITDGVTRLEQRKIDALLAKRPVRLHVLGIGTEAGAPVPTGDGAFLQDADGKLVVARLDPAPLRSIARAGGGEYYSAGLDDADIDAIVRTLDRRREVDAASATELRADQWRERGPWLLLLALPFAALAFRRGVITVLAVVILGATGEPVGAVEWESLWTRPDQRAARAYAAGEHARAAQLFTDPAWKAAAQYRQGAFEDAAKTLEAATTARDLYNRGNALARQGAYADALAAYDAALEREPDDEDTRYNRDLVAQELERQPPPQGGEPNPDPASDSESNPGAPQDDAGAGAEQAQREDSPDPQAGSQSQSQDAESEPDAQNPAQSAQNPADSPAPSQAPESKPADAPRDADTAQAQAAEDDTPSTEELQAAEQWLRRIPDDPGGLLRRKFRYQYQTRNHEPESEQPW